LRNNGEGGGTAKPMNARRAQMHIVTKKRLVAFWKSHPDAEMSLAAWFKIANKAQWASWADVQGAIPKASYYHCCLVFNICCGSYRLVVRRAARWGRLFVVGVYTHAEYDRGDWKRFCRCR
jgi:mRNA interferase HigB